MEENKKDSNKRVLEIEDRLFNKLKGLFEKGKEKEVSSLEAEFGLVGEGERSFINLNSGGGQQYQLATRFTKVEFPGFDGSEVQN